MNPKEKQENFSRVRSLAIDPEEFKDFTEEEDNLPNSHQPHQHSFYMLEMEMEKYQKQLDFIQDIMEEIKEFTDFYVLPIAENLTHEGIEEFLLLMKQV